MYFLYSFEYTHTHKKMKVEFPTHLLFRRRCRFRNHQGRTFFSKDSFAWVDDSDSRLTNGLYSVMLICLKFGDSYIE